MKTAISRDGTPLAYDRVGNGPPLVIVGGALSDRSAAADIAAALAHRLTVISYDRRGRGDSGDSATYDVAREIEDLETLIAETGGTASVYGHSSGGVLALRAVMAGAAIDRLVMYEPPFLVDDTRPPYPADFVATLQALVDERRKDEAVDYFMRVALLMPEEVIVAQHSDADWPQAVNLAHTLPYDMAVLGEQLSGRPVPTEWRDKVTIPTLILDGDQSPPFLRNPARQLGELLPRAERRTLLGFGHGAPAEVLVPILEEFLLR